MSSKGWERTPTGLHITRNRSLKIEIRPYKQEFRIYMNKIKGNKVFESEKLAMEFAFELIENGEAKNFAKRHPLPKNMSDL